MSTSTSTQQITRRCCFTVLNEKAILLQPCLMKCVLHCPVTASVLYFNPKSRLAEHRQPYSSPRRAVNVGASIATDVSINKPYSIVSFYYVWVLAELYLELQFSRIYTYSIIIADSVCRSHMRRTFFFKIIFLLPVFRQNAASGIKTIQHMIGGMLVAFEKLANHVTEGQICRNTGEDKGCQRAKLNGPANCCNSKTSITLQL